MLQCVLVVLFVCVVLFHLRCLSVVFALRSIFVFVCDSYVLLFACVCVDCFCFTYAAMFVLCISCVVSVL